VVPPNVGGPLRIEDSQVTPHFPPIFIPRGLFFYRVGIEELKGFALNKKKDIKKKWRVLGVKGIQSSHIPIRHTVSALNSPTSMNHTRE
jgi:hypothetical protein